jgi:hypothetical protein
MAKYTRKSRPTGLLLDTTAAAAPLIVSEIVEKNERAFHSPLLAVLREDLGPNLGFGRTASVRPGKKLSV